MELLKLHEGDPGAACPQAPTGPDLLTQLGARLAALEARQRQRAEAPLEACLLLRRVVVEASSPGGSLLGVQFGTDAELAEVLETQLGQRRREFLQALLAAAGDFAGRPAYQDWRRLEDALAAAGDKAAVAVAKAKHALGHARALLAEGSDPSPAEETYALAERERVVFENRQLPLQDLAARARTVAAGELRTLLEAVHQQARREAEAERLRLAVNPALTVGGLLEFRLAADLAADLAELRDVRRWLTARLRPDTELADALRELLLDR
jgi:hypothetical protein